MCPSYDMPPGKDATLNTHPWSAHLPPSPSVALWLSLSYTMDGSSARWWDERDNWHGWNGRQEHTRAEDAALGRQVNQHLLNVLLATVDHTAMMGRIYRVEERCDVIERQLAELTEATNNSQRRPPPNAGRSSCSEGAPEQQPQGERYHQQQLTLCKSEGCDRYYGADKNGHVHSHCCTNCKYAPGTHTTRCDRRHKT